MCISANHVQDMKALDMLSVVRADLAVDDGFGSHDPLLAVEGVRMEVKIASGTPQLADWLRGPVLRDPARIMATELAVRDGWASFDVVGIG